MRALVYQNAYYKTASTIHQKNSLVNALTAKNIDFLFINSIADFLKERPLVDFCIFLDKDYYAASTLEHYGIKLYNNCRAIMYSDSKIASYIKCLNLVDMPDSIFSPLRYTYQPLQANFLSYINQKLGYPLVLKADKSSLGKDVYLVQNEQELILLDKIYFEKRYILQEYIKESAGASVRAIVVGGKVVHFLKYTNAKDFRSNKELGGQCTPCNPSAEFTIAAQKVAKELGLFYCGVDFFALPAPKLIEVNSNAYFLGISECYNTNIAETLIAKILQDL